MKKALVLAFALALALASTAVLAAGPYFTLENEGLTLQPALVVGVDWETTIGDALTGPSFGGDFSITSDNILMPVVQSGSQIWNPNTINTALYFDIDWGAWRIESTSLLVVDPRLYPNGIEITTASSAEAKIVGVLDPVEVWGGVRFKYGGGAKWEPVLFFGIDVHWDL